MCKTTMTGYTYIQKHGFFDLTLPKSVIEVCNMLQSLEVGKFHFLEPTDTPNKMHIVKSRLIIRKLSDGSWNLTNTDSATVVKEEDEAHHKNVYIVAQPQNQLSVSEPSEDSELLAYNPDTVKLEPPLSAVEAADVVEGLESADMPEVVDEDLGLQDHNYTEEDCDAKDDKDGNGDDTDNLDVEEVDGYDVPIITSQKAQTPVTVEDRQLIVVKPWDDNVRTDAKSLTDIINNAYKTERTVGRMSRKQLSQCSVTCPICDVLSKDAFNLMKHLKRCHAKSDKLGEELAKLKPMLQQKCDECGHIFLNRKTLNEHKQNIHQNFMGVQCSHCKKKYRTNNHLRMHVKYVHLRKDKSFACDKCPSRFDSKKILETHILYHHTSMERIHKCDLCDYRYAFQKQYYEHRTRVHGPKKEICPHCGYKCATKWYMNKHIVGCNKTRLRGMPRKRDIVMDSQQNVQQLPVVPASTLQTQDNTSFAPSDVTDALVEIESRELVQTEISEPVVEIPTMWKLQPDTETVDSVATVAEDMVVEEEMIKEGDACQHFAITGPDGTQHIIQLIFPE